MNDMSPTKDWPARRWLLALLGGLIGVAINQLSIGDEAAWKVAFAAFLAVGGVALGFTVERNDHRLTFAFSILAALIVGGAIYWNGGPQGWESSEGWRMTCSVLAVAIAAPLFQAWRSVQRTGHAPIWSIPYETAHERAWLSLLIGFAALLFTAITFLLAWLLAALFKLIGLDFIERLLGMSEFVALLIGAAFGGAVGLLRDRDTIIATLHRVVMLVLSVLAPVMGAALLIFLIALPFTGLAPLWSATRSTTPILIGCVIGALTLANALIGDAPVDESKNSVLRWGAIALGAAMLPLAIIAAISTGLRIIQYGVTPDRLWAVVFTAVACAYQTFPLS